VVKKLKQLGILENTVIIFMSDNGPWYGGNAGGLKGMKATNWEGGIRVPFIISFPKEYPQGKEVKTPCWSLDILPTLMKLTGIRTNPKIKLDGQDISAIIKGKSDDHLPVFSMKDTTIRTIRDGKWKLILKKPDFYREINLTNWKDERGPDGATIIAPFAQATPADYPGVKPGKMDGEMLLFDLEKDPAESTDASDKFPQIKKKMIRKYEKYMHSIRNSQ
jgi:uncharacterized sulfatase